MAPPDRDSPEAALSNAVQTLTASDSARVQVGNSYNIHVTGGSSAETRAPYLMPFPRNENVVDRGIFAELDRLLPRSFDFHSAALWGLGGSGKTQIALEFAYRRLHDPECSVFWVHADNETTFTQDYKSIAARLGLAETLEGEKLLAAVRMKIEAGSRWLLALDNADDLSLFGVSRQPTEQVSLSMFVPQGPTGAVLWTSRDEQISGSLVSAGWAINISRMTSDEASTLLEAARNKTIGAHEADDAAVLLTELSWLPLAISQAAAYMRRTRTEIKAYLSKLQSAKLRWKALKRSEFDRHRRQHVSNSILETWSISIERIREENETAYRILHTLAFVENQNIPYEMISYAARTEWEPDQTMDSNTDSPSDNDSDDEDVIEATTRLLDFSFLSERTSNNASPAYEMHKLVQEATRYGLSRPAMQHEEGYFSNAALQAVFYLFPDLETGQSELWEKCEKYVGHAQQVAEWAELCNGERNASALLMRASAYLYDRGRWREREVVDSKTYELRKKTLGDRHPDTIWSMATLAVTYHALGRYREAESIKIEVLALRREILGEKHLDTIKSMAELAATYHALGRHREAESIIIEVLALRREILDEKHPDTIESMASLAATYHALGRYEEAEVIEVKALALQREILGDNHPDTCHSMRNLAVTWHCQGRLDGAVTLMQECLELQRNVLGPEHPETLDSEHVLQSWRVGAETPSPFILT